MQGRNILGQRSHFAPLRCLETVFPPRLCHSSVQRTATQGIFVIASRTLVLALTISPLLAAAQTAPARYTGTGSCSSSNCHGNAQPVKGSEILHNEYYTWTKHDKHSQAFTNLTKAPGRRMASLMGLGDPTKEKLCLSCHATYVPSKELQGENYSLEDGVSCESCHGAAEHWLSSHAETGATHQQNLARGLADTVTLTKRAQLCLSCHYGDETKSVTHDLYGAGHPRLSFELDTFGILQPKHWIVDQDYTERKAPYVPLTAWFIGQATNAQSVLAALKSPTRSKNGQFPELSLFDCFSCHHNLNEEQWKQRTYENTPGRLRLNLAPLFMTQATIGALDKSVATELEPYITTLHEDYQKDGAPQALDALPALLSSKVMPLITKLDPNTATCTAVLKALANFGARMPHPKYEVAEQIGMGIQAVLATSPELAKRYDPTLKKLFATLSSSKSFNPEGFSKVIKELAEKVQQ